MRATCEKIEQYSLLSESQAANLLWKAIYKYWTSYGDLPPREIAAMLAVRQGRCAGTVTEKAIMDEALQWFILPESMKAEKLALTIFKAQMDKAVTGSLQAKLGVVDATTIRELISAANKDLNSTVSKGIVLENPFDDWNANILRTENKTLITGVPWFDAFFDGGVEKGHLIYNVQPTKSGKTAGCSQLINGLVMTGQDCLYGQWEQRLAGDLARRQAIHATGWEKSKWSAVNWDWTHPDVPKEVLERFLDNKPKWDKHSRYFDGRKVQFANIQGLWDHLARACDERGMQPVMYLFDWWGELYGHMLKSAVDMNPRRFNNESSDRRYEKEMMHELHTLAERDSIAVYLTHQMAAAQNAKSDKHKATSADGAENKSLNMYADHALFSTKKDKRDNVTWTRDISRHAGHGEIRLKIDWEHSRFVPVESDMSANLTGRLSEAMNTREKEKARRKGVVDAVIN